MLKILILGDNYSGKTRLMRRYTDDKFLGHVGHVTIGVDFSTKLLEIEPGVKIQLQMWDTAGVESFRRLIEPRVRGTHGFLLVFDLTDLRCFKDIRHSWWFPLVPEGSQCLLVGTKCDDQERREVSGEEAEDLAKDLNMPYMETSAVTGHNVKEVFETLSRQIYSAMQLKKTREEEERREEEQKDKSGTSCVLS